MKSWTDRLDQGGPVVKPTPRTIGDVIDGQPMLVPTALQADEFIRAIPAGVKVDTRRPRMALAIGHGAEVACPVLTRYHLRTVAAATHEALQRGTPLERVTPVWRVLDESIPTTRRLGFGTALLRRQRAREGLD